MSSKCMGCTSSNKTTKGTLRLARKIKQVEGSTLEKCLKCICDPCDCSTELLICADATTVQHSITLDSGATLNGNVIGNVQGTLVGNVCLGLLKASVQIVTEPDPAVPISITSADMITQITLTDTVAPVVPYTGILMNGSEGQLKIINLIGTAAAGTVAINTGNGTLTLGTVPGTVPTSAELYFINGLWRVFQTQNATYTP